MSKDTRRPDGKPETAADDDAAARAGRREAERQKRLATGKPAATVTPRTVELARRRAGEN